MRSISKENAMEVVTAVALETIIIAHLSPALNETLCVVSFAAFDPATIWQVIAVYAIVFLSVAVYVCPAPGEPSE